MSGEREAVRIDWRPASDMPEFDHRPCLQFVWVTGSKDHSGRTWAREGWGLAAIRKPGTEDEWLGYRADDMRRICQLADVDPWSAEVTHWAPASVTTPHAPSPSDRIERLEAEKAELRALLLPFADVESAIPDALADHVGIDTSYVGSTGRRKWIRPTTVRAFRAVRRALQPKESA